MPIDPMSIRHPEEIPIFGASKARHCNVDILICFGCISRHSPSFALEREILHCLVLLVRNKLKTPR